MTATGEPDAASAMAAVGAAARVLDRVSAEVGHDRFDRYFDRRTRLSVHGRTLDVTVPSGFVAEVVNRRFGEALRRAMQAELGGGDGAVELRIRVEAAAEPEPKAKPQPEIRPTERKPARASQAWRHRFEDFIVGDANRLAAAAAQRLAEADLSSTPGPTSVFVHGSCGLGKTHLLHACCARFAETNPGAVIRITTGEHFTNEFVSAVRNNAVDRFRKNYRGVDLLAIDDVHFLAAKDATQRELLHIFDTLSMTRLRVMMASDEHPREIRRLSQHLVSRFVSGAVVRIDPPDMTLRQALVREIARRRGLAIEDVAVRLIAERAGTLGGARGGSVRDLEGLITQIEAVRLISPELALGPVGLAVTKRALGIGDAPAPRVRRPVPVAQIAAEVCRQLGVEVSDLSGKGRHKTVVLARELTVHLARRLTTCSYPEIARALGRDNHSTVLTAHKRLCGLIAAGEAPKAEIPEPYAGLSLGELAERLLASVERSA